MINKTQISQAFRTPSTWPALFLIALARGCKKRTVTIPRNRFSITVGTGRGQGLWCALSGLDYEPELRWLVTKLQPGDAFIDIGANIGIFSLHIARKVGKDGAVYALEPGSAAFRLLSRNLSRNSLDWAHPIKAAASNKPGELTIRGNPDTWNSLSLAGAGPGGETVPVTTLDKLCEERNVGSVQAIKIDAEGVEQAVILGGESLIRRDWPAIVFERTMESDENNPSALLKSWGYELHSLFKSSGQPSPNWLALHPRSGRFSHT